MHCLFHTGRVLRGHSAANHIRSSYQILGSLQKFTVEVKKSPSQALKPCALSLSQFALWRLPSALRVFFPLRSRSSAT